MGVLQLKIFLAAVMMGPEWWLKAALEQVINPTGIQLEVALNASLFSSHLSLSSSSGVPGRCARSPSPFHLRVHCDPRSHGPSHADCRPVRDCQRAGHLLGLVVSFVPVELCLLVIQFPAPSVLEQLADPTLEELVVLLRFCYPFALFVVAVVSFVTWQLKKLRTLAENIRNEK